jgi:hypothetical protein
MLFGYSCRYAALTNAEPVCLSHFLLTKASPICRSRLTSLLCRYIKCAAAHFIYYRQKVFMHSLGYRSLIATDSAHRNST